MITKVQLDDQRPSQTPTIRGEQGRRRRHLAIFFCSLLTTLACGTSARAWNVEALSGKEAQRTNLKGQKQVLLKGDKLNEGDVIETQNSRVKLKFSESTYIIAENSALRWSASDANSKAPTLDLLKGKSRALIDKITAPKFRYKIPSAVAGIRGTEFFMSASPEKEVICVLEGTVEAEELIGEKRKAALTENKGWIREGDKPPVIIETSEKQRIDWKKATEF